MNTIETARSAVRLYFAPLKQIGVFWKETWIQSKALFIAEMVGTLTGMAGASMLGFQSPTPDLLTIFTLYTVSAACFVYSNYIRHSAWLIILMFFYVTMNFVGLVKVLG